MATFVPRYYAIEQSLRARIAGLEPDEPLPSDAELCREFSVSRMTARNAVQRLVQEGLVYRLPGRGTFVADVAARRKAPSLTSFSEEMRRRGRVPSSRLIHRALRPAQPPEARALRLADGDDVVVVERVRLADGEALAVERAVLRGDTAPTVLAADLEAGSLHAALVGGGLTPRSGRATLRAEAAGDVEAALLGVPPGSALLVEDRVVRDAQAVPLEATETRYAGGRYSIDVEFALEQPRWAT